VRVADKFGLGKAKITMSFADWTAGKVAAATYEILIPEPDKGQPSANQDGREARKQGVKNPADSAATASPVTAAACQREVVHDSPLILPVNKRILGLRPFSEPVT